MREIDVEKWNRKTPYNCFSRYTNPAFSVTTRLDVTNLVSRKERLKTSFFADFLFVVTKALNEVEEFKIRLKDGKPVIYDRIDPSYIVMNDEKVIVTCRSPYLTDYSEFYKRVRADVERAEKSKQEEFNAKDATNDVFYTTCLPWTDLVSMINPYDFKDADGTSIPRIAWGKFVKNGDKYEMGMDISAHHALMDGYHVCAGFNKIQQMLDDIDTAFGK